MKKPPFERRNYEFEVRAQVADRGHILTGRPIVYGSQTDIGPFDEVIDAGALLNANLRDVPFLVNHNFDMIPLARSRRNNGNSTMQMTADQDGLLLDWVDLDTENNMDARALWSAVERGDVTGMSFCFTVDGESWDGLETEHPLRHITSIGQVVEVSAVTWPAYQATAISTRSREALESAEKALEKARESREQSLESDQNELALLKAKTQLLFRRFLK